MAMVRELHVRATVQPGGRIEVESPELTAGEDVDVTISPASEERAAGKRSAGEVLSAAPGHLVFKSAEEVDEYIREERGSWER